MDWFSLLSNVASRIPIERVLFPPRDTTKALEEFAATMPAPVAEKQAPPEQKTTPTITPEKEPPAEAPQEDIATACVPCALGHFSRSAGALEEAVRFKGEGITSTEIIDRVADVIKEQNALERFDLTPEKLRLTPPWEREIAEEALTESRRLRHRLESLSSIDQLEQAAADAASYYRKLNREWFKRRFAHLGEAKSEAIADQVAKTTDG